MEDNGALDRWYNASYDSVEVAAYDHWNVHGAGRSFEQYTDDALLFASRFSGRRESIFLADGSLGVRLRSGRGRPGGIFTEEVPPRIVSFWYR